MRLTLTIELFTSTNRHFSSNILINYMKFQIWENKYANKTNTDLHTIMTFLRLIKINRCILLRNLIDYVTR